MKFLRSVFFFLLFLRKLSKLGLLIHIAAIAKKRNLYAYIISLIFAPIYTIFIYRYASYNLASAIEKLGPVFVKFGQTLSTRPDIIGEEIAHILRSLQDKLQSFPSGIAKQIIEQETGAEIILIFSHFEEKEVAAASIAQVYKACLLNGEEVAIKVLRPDVGCLYKRDVNILKSIAYLIQLLFHEFRNIKLVESILVFESAMKQEMDFRNEAAHCAFMFDNFAQDESVKIPKVYWNYSTSKVLVLEWINGISIYDKKALEEANLDVTNSLRKLAVSFFNQAFRDGFFHADLHPGNILITFDGRVAFLDFGIVGFLSERDRIAMAEILYSLITKNYYRVAEIHKEIGFIPEATNLQEFALACRIVGEPVVNRAVNLVSVGHLLENLQKITSSFGMQTQPQLIMLQKTIIVVEGLGKILAPDVNMWHLAEPWIKKWASKNLGLDAKIIRYFKRATSLIAQKI
ncbi:MAG: 2-polyprenylphenol 6-hydroxylase [Alphaproteobacteria bacterium]|nr:2-polyprenylphenol 6-hydroxylase [Alphaproteobacteria bacterium]